MFLSFTFIVALVVIGTRLLSNSKSRIPPILVPILHKINLSFLPLRKLQLRPKLSGSGAQQVAKNGLKSGILKQVHFAEVIATSSSDGPAKQTSNLTATTKVAAKNGAKNKSARSSSAEQSKGLSNGFSKKDNSIPEIEEFDIDSLVDVTTNYSVISKANLVKKQHQQQQLNNKLGRKRHNSEGSKLNYSSEHLFKIIAATCLSKDEVEMAVETLLNKIESGDSHWTQPKNDPMSKLKTQLREKESALATEAHNHEQARTRLVELKQQLQSEKSLKLKAIDEVASLKKELDSVTVALEKTRGELDALCSLQHRDEEEKRDAIAKLEQEIVHLQTLLANTNVDEVQRLHLELEGKLDILQKYELTNENLIKNNQELETRLRNAEAQIIDLEAKKRNADYEARTKIANVESERLALEKAFACQADRTKEVLAANATLEKSLNDTRVLNNQQDDIIKRLHDERRNNEASVQRTLSEMETELRRLHEQLNKTASNSDERYRKELNHFERELNDAGQREQKLTEEMQQLRDGLSELFPDLQANVTHTRSDDWVHLYLVALKQLTTTVEELRHSKNNYEKNGDDREHSNQSTPSKRSGIDKSTLTLDTICRSTRVGSPISNGRSSRASSHRDRDKRLIEARLVEDLALFCLRCLD